MEIPDEVLWTIYTRLYHDVYVDAWQSAGPEVDISGKLVRLPPASLNLVQCPILCLIVASSLERNS